MTDIRTQLTHAVTAFDRRQQEKAAAGNSRHYYNIYALGQYLARVDGIMDDIGAGAGVEAAIRAGFTPGPLRKAVLKELGFADSKVEASGSYKGLPVYRPVTK